MKLFRIVCFIGMMLSATVMITTCKDSKSMQNDVPEQTEVVTTPKFKEGTTVWEITTRTIHGRKQWYSIKEPRLREESDIVGFIDAYTGLKVRTHPTYYIEIKLTDSLHRRLYPDAYK